MDDALLSGAFINIFPTFSISAVVIFLGRLLGPPLWPGSCGRIEDWVEIGTSAPCKARGLLSTNHISRNRVVCLAVNSLFVSLVLCSTLLIRPASS